MHTVQQTTEAVQLYNLIESVSKDKRPMIKLMVEAFIKGMNAADQYAQKPAS